MAARSFVCSRYAHSIDDFAETADRFDAQWLRSSVFLRPFADALNGGPQQTSCEESVVRLLSFTKGSGIESLHCQGH